MDKFSEYELKARDRCPDSDYGVVYKVQMRSVSLHLARYTCNRPEEEVIQHKGDKLKFVISRARKGLSALLCPGPPMLLRRPCPYQLLPINVTFVEYQNLDCYTNTQPVLVL